MIVFYFRQNDKTPKIQVLIEVEQMQNAKKPQQLQNSNKNN